MERSSTVDAYIAKYPPAVQDLLQRVRDTIHSAAPDATERISYGIPTYTMGQNVIHFGAGKNHIGLYPGADGVLIFAEKTTAYRTSKGAIQLPLDAPIPYDLIREITEYRVRAVTEAKQNKRR